MSDRLAEIEARHTMPEVPAPYWRDLRDLLAVAKAARDVGAPACDRHLSRKDRCGECATCRLRAALANLEEGA